MLGLGLSIPQVAVRGSRSLVAAIRSLFATNEPGVWYDPSDLSTMFQDSAGTTPVTTVEQPVGLMLDKSKGLVLGPELVTNGDFSQGSTGWTVGAGWTVTGGEAVLNSTSVNQQISQSCSFVSGKFYEVTFTVKTPPTNNGRISVIDNVTTLYVSPVNQAGTFTFRFLAVAGSNLISFRNVNTVVTQTSIDNISVRELPGNHAYQTTATSRPVLSARYNLLTKTEQFDDAVWVKTGVTVIANSTTAPDGTNTADSIVSVNGQSICTVYQNYPSVIANGPTAKASFLVKANGFNWIYVYRRSVAYGVTYFNLQTGTVGTNAGHTPSIESVGGGWFLISITASGWPSGTPQLTIGLADTDGSLSATGDGTSGIYIWGASLVPSDQAHLPYQRVNTSTDYDADPAKFPHYLRFDGVDDGLVTNTITPGIDKVQVFAGVRFISMTATALIAELSASASANNGAFILYGENVATAIFSSKGTTLRNAISSTLSPPTTLVKTGIGDISAPISALRLNGAQAGQSTLAQGTGNFLAYPLYIGRRGGTTLPFDGHLYSLIVRFGSNLPAATIEKTEKYINTKTGAY